MIFAKLRPDRVKTKTSSNMMYKSSDYTVVIRVKLTFFPSDAKINIMQSPERLKQQRTAWRKHNFKSDYTHSHLRNLSIFAIVFKQIGKVTNQHGYWYMFRNNDWQKVFLDSLIRKSESETPIAKTLFRNNFSLTLIFVSLIWTSDSKNWFLISLVRINEPKKLIVVCLIRTIYEGKVFLGSLF